MPAELSAKPRSKRNEETSASGRPDLRSRGDHLPDRHRMLPASADAEQGVVCSFLLAPREIGVLCAERAIKPESFHAPALATIFGILLEMWDTKKPIDVVTLTQTLHDRSLLEQVGGPAFISQLFTFLPTAANAGHYLEILQEKHTLREIIRVCTEFASRSYEEQDNVAGLLDEVETSIFEV